MSEQRILLNSAADGGLVRASSLHPCFHAQRLAAEILIPDGERLRRDTAKARTHENGNLIRRRHDNGDGATGVGYHPYHRIRQKGLRAKHALRLGPAEFRARSARHEREKRREDAGSCRGMVQPHSVRRRSPLPG